MCKNTDCKEKRLIDCKENLGDRLAMGILAQIRKDFYGKDVGTNKVY